MPKITPEKWNLLEETAIAILEGRASPYVIPARDQLLREKNILLIEHDLQDAKMSIAEIAAKRNVPVRFAAEVSVRLSRQAGHRKPAPSQKKPSRVTGIFSQQEIKEILAKRDPGIRGIVGNALKKHPWILKEERFSFEEIVDYARKELEWKLLVYPKSRKVETKDPAIVGRIVTHALIDFVLPEFFRRAYKQRSRRQKEKLASQIWAKDSLTNIFDFGSRLERGSSKSVSVAELQQSLVSMGFYPHERRLLLARVAGLNNPQIGRILGVYESRISVLLSKSKDKLGIKRWPIMHSIRQGPYHRRA